MSLPYASKPPSLYASALPVSARLNELTLLKNIPASATIELTRRCPLACAHCYLPETGGRASAGGELSTGAWKTVLGQLAEAGGLYAVFTGGEPLLRPDLPELCAYAKRLKFDVRVFSSGLGLTKTIAGQLGGSGVSAFELSVYGRAAVHDAVTGLKGSFTKTLAASMLLKKAGIKVRLKVPLMKVNFGERAWLERLAEQHGFGIAFDPVIAPGNDGDRSNLALRLNAAQLARLAQEQRSTGAQEHRNTGAQGHRNTGAQEHRGTGTQGHRSTGAQEHRGTSASAPASNLPTIHASTPPAIHASSLDFLCGAGRNVAAVDPCGNLYPCLQMPVPLGNLLETPFGKLWRTAAWLKKWRAIKTGDLTGCRSCRRLAVCNRCPGISLIEEGSPLVPNTPACAMAKARDLL